MAAVRRKEVVLPGADADLVDRLDTGVFELRTVGGGQVEQEPIARRRDESRVELGRDLRANLITAAADSGSDAGPDVTGPVLIPHEAHRRPGDPRARAAPACMHQAGDF